jgi:hypothetical protein
MFRNDLNMIVISLGTVIFLTVTGCQNLSNKSETQGAGISDAGGVIIGAAVEGGKHSVPGALMGGVLGAGSDYVVGASSDRITHHDTSGAAQATQQAQAQPATADQARRAATADLNNDGFVTLDEMVAMREAGFSDSEMLSRLQVTGQIFQLTLKQQDFLRSRGVSPQVVAKMHDLNREAQVPVSSPPGDDGVINQPASQRRMIEIKI